MEGRAKAGECIKSVWLYPAAAADSQGTWKRKISGLEMYQKRLEEQEKQLRPITRKCRTLVNTKESQGGAANMIFAYFHTFFLLDLIEYSSVVSG